MNMYYLDCVDVAPECGVEKDAGCTRVIGKNGAEWMQITEDGRVVGVVLFPQNIPTAYIGEKAQRHTALRYKVVCESEDDAQIFCRFFADFINSGYGDTHQRGNHWMVALDLEDINAIFSAGDMLYHRISLGANENKTSISEFCEGCNIQTAQTVFICIYSSPETKLDTFDSIIRKIESKLSDDCNVWVQFIHDDLLNEEIVIHLVYK